MRPLPLVFLAVALASAGPLPVNAADKPNIVFLLADDLGYGDLGCMGHPYSQTPSIDRLAKEGTLFHQFYVSGPTCCPTRTGFMTSRFPATFQKYPSSFGFSGAVTVTDLLSQNGYRTGHFGKWHIGTETQNGTYGLDVIKVLKGRPDDPRGRDAGIAAAAIHFIKANKDRPFYVNVWFHTPHNPVRPSKSFTDKFSDVSLKRSDFPNPDTQHYFDGYQKQVGDLDDGMRNYLGDVLQLDTQVGRILQAIDDLGLRSNTLVVFTSDNGAGGHTPDHGDMSLNLLGTSGPLQDRKHSLRDGGIRLPLIVRWPGHVPSGRVDSTSVLSGVDWLPTLCSLAGIPIDPAQFSGEDVSAVWLGEERPRTKDLFWKVSKPHSPVAMRRGPWKLYQPYREPAQLYDLSTDPAERQNVADQHPSEVRELSAALQSWNAKLPKTYAKDGKRRRSGKQRRQ